MIEGDKGKELRTHAMKWKKMAGEAVHSDGSSNSKLNKVVKEGAAAVVSVALFFLVESFL